MPELDTFLALFQQGAVGKVSVRQSTFWLIEAAIGAQSHAWRVDLEGRSEAVAPHPNAFSEASLSDTHPLLLDYHEPWLNLYTAGVHPNPRAALQSMTAAVSHATHGSRILPHYAKPERVLAILQSLGGLVLAAPRPVAESVLQALHTRATPFRIHALPGVPAPGPRRVLQLGNGYLVARSFRARRGYA